MEIRFRPHAPIQKYPPQQSVFSSLMADADG
jgi:hypothetical protein